MREIKFRVWDTAHPWVTPMFWYSEKTGLGKLLSWWEAHKNRLKENALQQYTGAKDKNGREIYEGDLLSSEFYNGKVMFEGGGFIIYSEKDDFIPTLIRESYFDWEVVGNIFENPVDNTKI